jgi:hypothetical protein
LPDKIVNILEEYNGGRPSEKDIITNTKREYVFKSLLSYNKNDKETIYNVYPDLFKGVPLYPIGTDAAGNFICYNFDNKKIVLLNHENNNEEEVISIPFIE